MTKPTNKQEHSSVDQSRPFLGLRSFEEKNKSQFGGRDHEINALFNLVEDKNLTVVFGTSGIGKTSLLKAGLMPKLRQKFYFPIYIRIDYSSSKSPLMQLKGLVYEEMKDMDASIKAIGRESLWEYMHDVNFLNGLATPVLILDQFEEIFTVGKHNKGVKYFVTELADLAQNRIPTAIKDQYKKQGKTVPSRYNKQSYRVVISLREDYLAQLDELKRYIPAIMDHGFRVTQMTIAQAMEAAIKPGKGLIDETVAKAIIKILPGISQADFDLLQSKADDNKKLKVEPFLLSLICDRLNEKRIEMKLNTITSDLVAQFKVDDVIKSFYNDTINKYDPNVDEAIQNELLNSEGYRKLHALKEFQTDYKISDTIIDALVSARIIRNENRNNVDYLELIHDVLAPIIKKKRDDRLKAEQEAKHKAEIAKQEAEREAAILQEKERIKKRNKRRATVIIPIVIIIVAVAITSSLSVYFNDRMVKKLSISRDLLNNSKSELIYSAQYDSAASYTAQAFELFKKYKKPEYGHNIFEPLYYNSLLVAYKNLYRGKNDDTKLIVKYSNEKIEVPIDIGELPEREIVTSRQRRKLTFNESISLSDEPPPLGDEPPSMDTGSSSVNLVINDEEKENIVDFFQEITLTSLPLNEEYYIGFGRGKVQKLTKIKQKDLMSSYSMKPLIENPENHLKEPLPLGWNTQSIAFNYKNLLAIAEFNNLINIYNTDSGTLYKQINIIDDLEPQSKEFIKSVEFNNNGEMFVLNTRKYLNNENEIYSIIKWDNELNHQKNWDIIEDQQYWTWEDLDEKAKGFKKEIIDSTDLSYLKFDDKLLIIPEINKDSRKEKSGKILNCFSTSGDSKIVIGIKNGIVILTKDQYLEISDKKRLKTNIVDSKVENSKTTDLANEETITSDNEEYFGNIVAAKFNPTGQYLVIGNDKGQVFTVNLTINKKTNKITDLKVEKLKFFHEKRIVKIAFHPNDKSLENANFATADLNGLVINWNMDDDYWSAIPLDYKVLYKKNDDTYTDLPMLGEVMGLHFVSDSPYLVVFYGDENNTIIRWPATMDELYKLLIDRLEVLKKLNIITN